MKFNKVLSIIVVAQCSPIIDLPPSGSCGFVVSSLWLLVMVVVFVHGVVCVGVCTLFL
jgi:hypothetical protein